MESAFKKVQGHKIITLTTETLVQRQIGNNTLAIHCLIDSSGIIVIYDRLICSWFSFNKIRYILR